MNKEELILIGGGGHCVSCIDVIEQEGKYSIAGIIDLKEKIGQKVLNYPIIACDDDLSAIADKYDHFLISIAHIKSPLLRDKFYTIIKELGKNLATVISPKAYVSQHSTIGEGTIVMHHAVVNANSIVGDNCIINSQALIEHDSKIGYNNHISTDSVINGNAEIGDNCFIGSKSAIANGVHITDNVVVGIGSVVLKNIESAGVYHGVPAKEKS